MARTVSMQLIELMIHKRDISFVLEYLGKKVIFSFNHILMMKKLRKQVKNRELLTPCKISALIYI